MDVSRIALILASAIDILDSSATLDRIYRINKIKAALIHPDYPVNPVKIIFNR